MEASAGQTLELRWSTPTAGAAAGLPPESAASEERTEAHVVMVKLGYDHNPPNRIRRMVVWTRPGKGNVLAVGAVPPGRYEGLALPTSLELQAIAVTDLETGQAQLKRRGGVAHLRLPHPKKPGDRVSILRLYLDLEPLGP